MKDRRVTLAVAAVALAALGALAWLLADLFTGEEGGVVPVVPAVEAPAAARPTLDVEDDDEDVTSLMAAVPVAVPGPSMAGPTEMPESYRRSLGAIVGRVVEEDGAPVPDMAVEVVGGRISTFLTPQDSRYYDDLSFRDIDLVQGRGVTDAEGRFRIEALRPRTLGALVVDPAGPRNLIKVMDSTPAAGEDRDVGDIVLPLTVTLAGRVVDVRGVAVAGARVRATDIDHPFVMTGLPVFDYRPGGGVLVQDPDQGESGRAIQFVPTRAMSRLLDRLPIPQTTTDAEGRFEVSGVRPGFATLVVDDGRHLTAAEGPYPTGIAGSRRDVGTLTMPDAVTLRGQVLDDEDEPLAEATVMVGSDVAGLPITAAVLQPPVVTDAEGRFTVGGLRPGPVSAAVRAASAVDFLHQFSLAPEGDELTLRVPGGRELVVIIEDEDGRPVPDASLFGLALVGDESAWDEYIPAYVLPSHRLDDRVTQEVPGRYVIDDLDPIRWRVTAVTPRHALAHEIVDLSDHDGEVTLGLQGAHVLPVQALRALGETPVEFALVEVWPKEGGRDAPFTAGRTDAAGRVELPRLQEGEYELRLAHPALAVTSAEASVPAEEDVVVLMHAGATVRGEVFEDGGPPAEPVMVAMTRWDGDESDSNLPRTMVTRPDGTFTFTHVEPGKVELAVIERLPALSGFNLVELFVNTPLATAELEVPPEGEVPAVLILGSELEGIDTAFVSGRLFVNGRPAEGWKVRCWGEVRRSATVGADGAFEIGVVAAGENVISYTEGGSTMRMFEGIASEELTLEPDEHRRLNTSISIGSIEGRVRSDDDGRLIKSAQVTATIADAEGRMAWLSRSETLTLEDGSFRFDPVAAGEYVIRAEAVGYTTATSDPVTVRELQNLRGVELRLGRAFEVTGVVTVTGLDEGPTWMWLVARDEKGGHSESTRVEEGEPFTLDQVGPGTYDFYLSTGLEVEFAPVRREIRQAGEHLELVFEPETPDAEALQRLEELGYSGG